MWHFVSVTVAALAKAASANTLRRTVVYAKNIVAKEREYSS